MSLISPSGPDALAGTRSLLRWSVVLAFLSLAPPVWSGEEPVIAAASSLNGVLQKINDAFARESGTRVRISFGASGNLTRQIEQGAPFELFLSADRSYVKRLADQGLGRGSGEIYARGRLALFVPEGAPLRGDPDLDDLSAALADGRLRRLAIANPDHAPYGRAAREALQHRGLWAAASRKLLLGENVAQAAQFAVSGADAGLLSYSVALELTGQGSVTLLPGSWHGPLDHYMLLLNPAGDAAAAFYRFLKQPAARRAFGKFGFSVPDPPQ